MKAVRIGRDWRIRRQVGYAWLERRVEAGQLDGSGWWEEGKDLLKG